MTLMRADTLSTFLSQLSRLPPDQLLQIERTCHGLRAVRVRDTNQPDDWLFDAIVDNLDSRGLKATIPSYKQVRANSSYLSFQEQSQSLRDLFARHLPNLSKIQERLLASRIIQVLVHHLTYNWTTPGDTSFWGLILNLRHATIAIERAYPGYLKAGLGHLILNHAQVIGDSRDGTAPNPAS